MKRYLVTGATGFVGRRLVDRLLAEGSQVRVLVRNPGRLPSGARSRVEVVRGNLTDSAALAVAAAEVDIVLHLAALATAFERDPDRYFRVNVQGLEMLLQAAEAVGVRRLVHVSSVAATTPRASCRTRGLPAEPTPYARSKMAGEALVRGRRGRNLETVIVRPTRVYGPGPWNDANGTTRLIAMYLRGTFRFVMRDGGARANYVHVDDVVDGILRAADRGRAGAAYMLGGQDATLTRYLDTIAALTGVKRRVLTVPPEVLVPVAYLMSWWGHLGGKTSLTPGWLNNFLEDRPADISGSVADLGYAPRNLRTGLAQTIDWLTRYGGRENHADQADTRSGRSRIRIRPRELWA
jgi:nucleoside-diphosphate-sugar epimerase